MVPEAVARERAEEVAEEFPDWMVFRSDRGRFWASLRRELTRYEMAGCCDRMVDADDLDTLVEKLREQELKQQVAAASRRTKPRTKVVP
ncbi:hypothetical protein [Bailinhaonella thermotolerans]|uniref:Uncharacterized protein n=1 Tax=Bailinhaonella thermotolerans TaxID=1070861 RepID=A0A3A3ZZZ0_9ACTN|nr:hypothetical protein [Bailinhaonella thermotolerans]RJL21474.1 hypothetical protein D5H75_37580 [Bailinhaonella thermotolerans]